MNTKAESNHIASYVPAFRNFWEECENAIFDEMNKHLQESAQQLGEKVEFALRNMVQPPIRGEITRGKIKWRGLKLVYETPKVEKDDSGKHISVIQTVQLWQRDKRIF